MKMNKTILAAALLICTILAGCTSNAFAQDTETSPVSIPEKNTVTPETMSSVETSEATEEFSEVPTEAKDATEAPTETVAVFTVEITPVITETQNQVTVTTVDEFIAAIGPNTEIIVDAELIDFSKASDYGTGSGEYYRWAEAFDGPELYITGVSNFTIRGSGEDHNANVLSAVPRYANVLNFENCSNIMVKGLTVGHAEQPGACAGGVLNFVSCQDILVEDCGLFGCGTLGVRASFSKNMQIVNNDIYDCSVGGVEFTCCDAVNVDGNTFRDLGGRVFRIYDCGTITYNGKDAVELMPYLFGQ